MKPALRCLGVFAAAIAGLCAASVLGIGWWIDSSDAPVKSDAIVVLAGDFARPLYAADLYKEGYAPELWLARPAAPPSEKYLAPLGLRTIPEEDLNREILIKKGVPAEKIHLYGKSVQSTTHEAMTLSKESPLAGKSFLVVTSRYHVRRSRMTFRHFFPKSEIRVVATPYNYFTRRWWSEQDLARNSILEILKTAFYLAGGAFLSSK